MHIHMTCHPSRESSIFFHFQNPFVCSDSGQANSEIPFGPGNTDARCAPAEMVPKTLNGRVLDISVLLNRTFRSSRLTSLWSIAHSPSSGELRLTECRPSRFQRPSWSTLKG